MKAPLLSVRRLGFAYPNNGSAVLDDITFDIYPGSVNTILGPNGAGKSTLLHLILGLYPPKTGDILLHGRPLHQYSRSALSRMIGLVPQSAHVPFDYRVLEYVLLGRTPHLDFFQMPSQSDVQVVHDVLRRLALDELAERRVTALSGGEHQMVLIARSLVQETPLLLLDEPTSHLDLGNKRRILILLRELAAQGMTILFTTHDPESASLIADSLLLMRGGRLLHQGTPADTFTTQKLAQTYQTPLRVLNVDKGRVVLLDVDVDGDGDDTSATG